MRQIVIVGASIAGLRAAEAIRSAGWRGRLVVAGAEAVPPYSRPQVSKQLLLGTRTVDAAAVPHSLDDVDWMLGVDAVDCDTDSGTVGLADGRRLDYDGLVVATGVRPRLLDVPGARLRGVTTLRTAADAARLHQRLTPGARLVVLGAGFIGGEVASAARKLSCHVTLVDPDSAPLARLLGADGGRQMARLHEANGVDLRMGRVAVGIHGDTAVTGVELDDGSVLAADTVLIATGSRPNTEWLDGTGLDITDGVLCDARCYAVGGDDRIVAAGDAARWPVAEIPIRVEHWSVAGDHGTAAGSALVSGRAAAEPFRPLLSVTSRQHGASLAILGSPRGADMTIDIAVEGDRPQFVATYRDGDGRLVGAATLNANSRLAELRSLLADQSTPRSDLVAHGNVVMRHC